MLQRTAKPCTPVQFWSWPPPLIIDFIIVSESFAGAWQTAPKAFARSGKTLRGNGFPPAASGHRVASVGGWFAVGGEFEGARSVDCPGGSRACAMLTRQPCCEVEIVPSLHSNLAGAVSATGAVFSCAAACWGAGANAAGFSDRAQPAQQSEINTAMPIRIWVASGPLQRPMRMVSCYDQPAAAEIPQHTTAGHDSNIEGLTVHPVRAMHDADACHSARAHNISDCSWDAWDGSQTDAPPPMTASE